MRFQTYKISNQNNAKEKRKVYLRKKQFNKKTKDFQEKAKGLSKRKLNIYLEES